MKGKKMIRIDKYLSDSGLYTRKEAKALIASGKVSSEGNIIKDPGYKISPENADIAVNGKAFAYSQKIYIMLNKPAGVVSAVTDSKCKTVVDIMPQYKSRNIFPVGRLDKDTRGLLILTNDGEFAHNTLSPKKHVEKVYYFKCTGNLNNSAVDLIKNGVIIDVNYKCLPAKLNIIKQEENYAEGEITIREGKFHQVKKMIAAVGGNVVYLKRIKFGGLELDKNLEEGQYILMDEETLKKVFN